MNVENAPAGRRQVQKRPKFTGQDSHLADGSVSPTSEKTRSPSEKTRLNTFHPDKSAHCPFRLTAPATHLK